MSDYLKGVIYKLHKDDMTEIYIGSTADEKHREECHKSNCNNENSDGYNLKIYIFIRENGGMDNWKFEVIERFPCENDIQLRIREQYYYDLFKPELNTYRPLRTEEDLKEYHRIYNEKYYQDNIEEMKEKMKKYYQDNIEEIKLYNAKYYLDNIDELKDYQENYRKENRKELATKQKQKHDCDCGGKYTRQNILQHLDTNKHKKFIKKQK